MDVKKLAELQEPDARTRVFVPFGHAGGATAEEAAERLQEVIAAYDLAHDVPDDLRISYERVRTLYTYGALCYDFFAVARDQARLVLERALRERFLHEYAAGAVFVDADGGTHTITPRTAEQLRDELTHEDRLRGPARWRLLLRSGKKMYFDGMLDSLVRWARAEDLLHGQHNRHREKLLAALRNQVAHGMSDRPARPGEAAQAIADLAEIINRLWDQRTPGGRLYPAATRREVVAIGWGPNGDAYSGIARYFGSHPPVEGMTCVLVRADPRNELFEFDAQYELTQTPCELLWGPGTWPEAVAWLEREQPVGDDIDLLDRYFLVRYHDCRVYLPRRPELAAGLEPGEQEGVWRVIRADGPREVFSHARQLLAGVGECSELGACRRCALETLRRGTWRQALDYLVARGIEIKPRTAPDVRVPSSGMPRWNEIQGLGAWSVPAS